MILDYPFISIIPIPVGCFNNGSLCRMPSTVPSKDEDSTGPSNDNTQKSPSSKNSNSNLIPIVAGASIGGGLVLVGIVVGIILFNKTKQKKKGYQFSIEKLPSDPSMTPSNNNSPVNTNPSLGQLSQGIHIILDSAFIHSFIRSLGCSLRMLFILMLLLFVFFTP